MSLNNAIKFVKEVSHNRKFFYVINHMESAEVKPYLKTLDMEFNDYEFENAINHMLVRCQFEQEAATVKEIQMWYTLMLMY